VSAQSASVPAVPVEQSGDANTPLLSLSTKLGPDLFIVDFCAAFELSLEIRVKLADINSYTGA
jgi:hypothetical protein